MEISFSDAFKKSLGKYSSKKKIIKKKIDMIIEHPVTLGEPLKGNLRGYYSCAVKRNFLIIFLYCKVCRKKGDDEIVLCKDCDNCTDDTLKFVELGPHNQAYGKK